MVEILYVEILQETTTTGSPAHMRNTRNDDGQGRMLQGVINSITSRDRHVFLVPCDNIEQEDMVIYHVYIPWR